MEIDFAGVRLRARPGVVMTPRPATERLVERVLAHVGDRHAHVADVGTGSGAIAVVLAVRAPNLRVCATDISASAVTLARENALAHGVGDRVAVVEGDLLAPLAGPLDLVAANLPYLPEHEGGYEDEPPAAVYAPGDGLGHVRRLLAQAAAKLAPGGLVVLQYRGDVVEATRAELPLLRARFAEAA